MPSPPHPPPVYWPQPKGSLRGPWTAQKLILIASLFLCHAGVWRTFTGNEIGILLAHWMWCCWRRDHLDDDPACVVMLASAVSSKMLQAMAQVIFTCICTRCLCTNIANPHVATLH